MLITSKNKPKISVILPVFNGEKYLGESISSILQQSINDLELIIIDDLSTDNTASIISSYADKRIISHTPEKPLGLVKSLNLGLDMARGEFIARMDADDICYPNRFLTQLKLMSANKNISVCGGCIQKIGSANNCSVYQEGHDELKARILFYVPFPHPFVMLRGSYFKNNHIQYDESVKQAEDYELWLRLAHKHEDCLFANAQELLGEYRVHTESICNSQTKDVHEAALESVLPYLEKMCGQLSKSERLAHKHLMHRIHPVSSPEQFIERKHWLLKLQEKNRSQKIYDEKHFNDCLLKLFVDLSIANLWLGPWLVKQLASYPGVGMENSQIEELSKISLEAQGLHLQAQSMP